MRSRWLAVAVGFCALAPFQARAGEGEMVEDGDGSRHLLNLNYQFRYVPTQAEIDRVKEQLLYASETLCDVTDGQMRIGHVSLNAGGPNDELGDIWEQPQDGRSGVGGVGSKGNLGQHGKYVNLFHDDVRSTVIAHELGHYVFGMLDQYDEQRRDGGPCGIGRSFEPTPQTDRAGNAFSKDESNHSLMESSANRKCATPDPANPGMFVATPRDCFSDGACMMGETCEPFLTSELSVARNTDIIQGDTMSCAAAAAAGVYSPCCGTQSETTTIVLSRNLNRASPTVASGAAMAFDATSFATAAMTAAHVIDNIEVLDASTKRAAERYKESSHKLRIYAEHTDTNRWSLHFGIDAQEQTVTLPDDEPTLAIVHTMEIVFDASGVPSTTDSTTLEIDDLDTGSSDLDIVIDFNTITQNNAGFTVRAVPDGIPMCRATDAKESDITSCTKYWNTSTQRYEGSQQTVGRSGRSDWEQVVHAYSFFSAPANRPDPVQPGSCDNATLPISFDENIDGSDQVILVIDRSGSMRAKVKKDSEQTRLEYAQAAARAFADRRADSAIEIGLVEFNHDSGLEEGLGLVTKGASLDAFKAKIDGLTPSGETAIGDALLTARDEMVSRGGRHQTIFLLSDGQNNSGVALDTAKDEVKDAGIRVFAIAVGEAADREQLADVAGYTDGHVVDAEEPESLPGIYAELDAISRGYGVLFPHTRLPVGTEELPSFEISLLIEEGTEELTFLISAAEDVADWSPEAELTAPSGATFTAGSPEVTVDPFFIQFKIPGPEPGAWQFELRSTAGIDSSVLTVTADNPEAECFAAADKQVVTAGETVNILPTASYGGELVSGVAFAGAVLHPSGTGSALTFTPPSDELGQGTYSAPFNSFDGRGVYRALVACVTGNDAATFAGDVVLDEPPNDVTVPRFGRAATASFFYDVPQLPSCSASDDDCDDDGIPNAQEQAGDTDGDGVPNDRDDDSDGDDVPDGDEGVRDGDGDGRPNAYDTDSDNDGTRDGFDTVPPGSNCQVDQVPPVITAPARTVQRCEPRAATVQLTATATDASCAIGGVDLDARVISVHGKTLATPIVVGADLRVTLPTGASVVEWTATDVNGNVRKVQQTITVAVTDTAAACCEQGQAVVMGNAFPNVFVNPFPARQCIFGLGGIDTVVSGPLPDFISGGGSLDTITAGGEGSRILGGDGLDIITVPIGGGSAYGGPGSDVIEMTGGGTIHGNAGDDSLITILGDSTIVGGPGRDVIEAGTGNDSVYIYDVCEIAPFEAIDGSLGNDTLYTPVPLSQLIASGVIVIGFENIVVTDANRHLSECF